LADDPRQHVKRRRGYYDGILLLPADPVSLSANRLFTREAFREYASALRSNGLFSFSLTGTENYLGDEMEQTLLSAHRTARAIFPGVFAIPGDPVTFWCSPNAAALATDPERLATRFADRSIVTSSFSTHSFRNLLLPFRVDELHRWLQRSIPVSENSDLKPTAFTQQLRLWNVYTDSGIGPLLTRALALTTGHFALGLTGLLLLLLIGQRLLAATGRETLTIHACAGISGSVGILLELALIFLYQVRCGALFHLLALFFGLYMCGLALGAGLAGRCRALTGWELPVTKIGQVLAVFLGGLAVLSPAEFTGWCTGSAIFLFALLAGFEFAILDRLLRERGTQAGRSAGALLLSDNGAAVCAAVLSGPILLPTAGIFGTLQIALVALLGNLLLVLFGLSPTNQQTSKA
ncbi:MAG TPA: hypothetical protein PKO06_17795, partial [Candidatus Ozemobacteraceae bacterium]|nr:hypothetical protein [Candidatus Ozemobacteraceae bacterium]